MKNPTYGKNIDFSLLLLRIAAGGFMLTHGYGKMTKLFAGTFEFSDPIGLGVESSLVLTVFAEILCALFVLLGILPRLASIPLIITMLVAVFVVHAEDGFKKQELGLFFLISYIIILILGAGRFSVQSLFSKK
jgi:putative oxidoreductase